MATEFFKNFYRKADGMANLLRYRKCKKQKQNLSVCSFDFCISDKRMKKVRYRLEY